MTRCNKMGNTCPSRNNCQRYTCTSKADISEIASLNHRREAGASACDLFKPVKLVSTFAATKRCPPCHGDCNQGRGCTAEVAA